MHRYLPMTVEDRKEMLQVIGVQSVDELFQDIPENVRFKGDLQIKKALSESELVRELTELAQQNISLQSTPSFLGAGVYKHYVPIVVDHVISRSEFYTAYTPYQPEISQGELQAIFEFQTMICELTSMDVANSSMYDGGTALAEAMVLASGQTRKKKILLSKAVHPQSRDVVKTYAKAQNLQVVEIELEKGLTNLEQLEKEMDEDVASVIVQYPNFFGNVEDLQAIEKVAHQQKGLFIVSSNPLALGILTPPGEFGADIVVGDAQPFGIPAQFGGPHCGYFATTSKLMRKIPGRLVGQTVDTEGNRSFVLTLQAREQHIRRDKATSNICSNQALNALAASVAMTALGKKGVREIAYQNIQKTQYALKQFLAYDFHVAYQGPVFNEFVLFLNKPVQDVNDALLAKGIIGGYDLSKDYPDLQHGMLVAMTELTTKEEIDTFVAEMGEYK